MYNQQSSMIAKIIPLRITSNRAEQYRVSVKAEKEEGQLFNREFIYTHFFHNMNTRTATFDKAPSPTTNIGILRSSLRSKVVNRRRSISTPFWQNFKTKIKERITISNPMMMEYHTPISEKYERKAIEEYPVPSSIPYRLYVLFFALTIV